MENKNNNNKIWTGLVAGAAVGLLTFFLVKPKPETKTNKELSDKVQTEKGNTPISNTLFI